MARFIHLVGNDGIKYPNLNDDLAVLTWDVMKEDTSIIKWYKGGRWPSEIKNR
jgi:hypothetical protein